MDKIIPRWEWRTFGPSFGPAEAHFAALEPTGVQESDELYLLSGMGDNVKVRDDLMDIKVFVETNADGLEQWRPVLKAAFPLARADAVRVLEALRLPSLPLERDAYTLDQFLAELAGDALRPVHVHKRRVRYRVGGCTSEVTDVVADGRPTRTIAIELEDADAVVAAVRSVGLSAYLNTSYSKGLAALLDGGPQRFAVIDAGTNSIKFHVAERGPSGWHAVLDRAELTRLGEGLEDAGRDLTRGGRAGGRGHRLHGRRGPVAGRRRDRRGRDGRAADRDERRRGRGRRSPPARASGSRSSRARRRAGSRSSRWARRSTWAMGRWPCSTPAAAAASSRSGMATSSTSGSAWTSARSATRSGSGSITP